MAQVGLKYPVYAKYAEAGGNVSYTDGAVMGKGISAGISWTQSMVDLRADDEIAESDYTLQYGTVTIGVDELSDETLAALLGHTVAEGEIAYASAQAPYVGVGFYGKVVKDGVAKWRCVWLPKVKFGTPNEQYNTKGETIAFQTSSIEGRIMKDAVGHFYKKKLFDTEAEAIAFLNDLVGITPKLAKPVASVAGGTYGDTQSVTLTAGNDTAIYYTTNGTTPSATNGTLYTTAISIEASCALKAVAVKAGFSNSDILVNEYFIT